MGKLSIKQKAERYDKIIEIAKSKILYPDKACYVNINEIFPELVKSEDELIKERLIGYFSDFRLGTFAGLEPKKIIDWLNKQGIDDAPFEQESAEWSKEDEEWRRRAIDFMKHPEWIKTIPAVAKNTISWLKSKGKLPPQSQWEPSNEQMEALNIALRCGIQLGSEEEKALKSLREQLRKLKKQEK